MNGSAKILCTQCFESRKVCSGICAPSEHRGKYCSCGRRCWTSCTPPCTTWRMASPAESSWLCPPTATTAPVTATATAATEAADSTGHKRTIEQVNHPRMPSSGADTATTSASAAGTSEGPALQPGDPEAGVTHSPDVDERSDIVQRSLCSSLHVLFGHRTRQNVLVLSISGIDSLTGTTSTHRRRTSKRDTSVFFFTYLARASRVLEFAAFC